MSDPQQPLRVTLEELADAAKSEPGALLSAAEQPAVASTGREELRQYQHDARCSRPAS